MRQIPFFLYNIEKADLEKVSQAVIEHSILNKNPDGTMGKTPDYVGLLEEKVKELGNIEHAIAVRSEASALILALQALGIKRNHKIICSVYCHPFVPECIRYFEAEPLFVDIDPETLAMDANKCQELLASKKHERIKAIVVSHIGDTLCDMEPFYAIKEEYGLGLIEDASCSAWLRSKTNQLVGSDPRTDFSVFAYFPGIKTRLFHAGMVITNNPHYAELCKTFRYHSKVREESNSGLFYDVIDTSLDHTISVIAARFALLSFERLEEQKKRRKEIAAMYIKGLKDIENIQTPPSGDSDIYTLFIVRFKKRRDRIASLLKEAGIETALHFIPINFLNYYKIKFDLKVTQFPNALQVYQEVLSLPVYSGMSDDDVQYIIKTIKEIVLQDKE